MSEKAAPRLAWLLWAAQLALAASGAVLAFLNDLRGDATVGLGFSIVMLALSTVGALVASRQPFTVQDDGVGFDPTTTRFGSGLTNIRDRLEAVGGTLEISSAPGEGSTITGRIPSRATEESR